MLQQCQSLHCCPVFNSGLQGEHVTAPPSGLPRVATACGLQLTEVKENLQSGRPAPRAQRTFASAEVVRIRVPGTRDIE